MLGVPSQALRENLRVFRDSLPPAVPIVSLAKGVEIGTGLRMSEVIARVGQVDPGADRGADRTQPGGRDRPRPADGHPCWPAPTTSGRVAVQVASATPYFRPYTITDVIGAEIAGTGKNIVALACGIADGLGLGLNTSASLITRGLNEVSRLGVELGAAPATFAGLAGLGDLVATCWSPLSRNRTLGGRLAAGHRAGGGAGGDRRAGGRGCGQLPVGAGPGAPAQDRHADHRVGLPGLLPASAADPDDQLPDGPAAQPGVSGVEGSAHSVRHPSP